MTDSVRLRQAGAVLVPALLGLALTLYDLPTRSLWIDESATVSIASQHGAALLAGMKHDGGNMLVFYAVVHVLIGWFGDGTFVLRIPASISTAVAAAAVSLIGIQLFSLRAGLAAGLLFVVSAPAVYWGQDARAYMPMVMFVTLSFLAFVALVRMPAKHRSGLASAAIFAGYVLTLVLGLYMSLVVVLVVPAQLVAMIWYRRNLLKVTVALAVSAAACLPLAVIAYERGSGQLFWVQKPSLSSTLPIVQLLASSNAGNSLPSSSSSNALLVLTGVVLVAIGVVGLWRARAYRSVDGISDERFAGSLVAGWLVIPLVLLFAESEVGQSLYESRYALICIPAVALLIAWGLFETHLPAAVAFAGCLVLLVLRAAEIWPIYGVSNENWTGTTSHVLSHAAPGSCIAFYPSDTRMPFAYYLPRELRPGEHVPRPVLPSEPLAVIKPFVEDYAMPSRHELRAWRASCRSMWLVESHVGSANGTPLSRIHRRNGTRLVRELEKRYPTTRTYHVPSPVTIRVWRFSST